MNRDFVRDALLQHNYFPNQKEKSHELPPCFSTTGLDARLAAKIRDAGQPFVPSKGHDYVPYTLTRYNGGPRVCGVPHPYPYCRLVLQILTSWGSIEPKLSSSASAITAKEHADGRLFKMDYGPHAARSNRYVRKSASAKFVAHADISNFFPSIYTHAIPWAVLGIDAAKQGASNTWSDKLDRYVRDCRRGETNGVSIGPGTSSLVAELILSRVDRSLQRKFEFDRYIDDYTAFCRTRQDAEDFLRRLEFELSRFNLYLNYNKTSITELPHPEVPEWVDGLRVEQLPASPTLYEVKTFLSRAVSLSTQFPDGSVLRYAVNALSSKSFSPSVGRYVVMRIFGISLNKLHLCSSLATFLPHAYDKAGNFKLEKELVALIDAAVSSRRSDAICWSLWIARETKTQIDQSLQEKCRRTFDVFGTVLLYMIGSAITRRAITRWVRSRILSRPPSVQERNWMLIHYLYNESKLSTPEVKDKALRVLKKAKVNFYN